MTKRTELLVIQFEGRLNFDLYIHTISSKKEILLQEIAVTWILAKDAVKSRLLSCPLISLSYLVWMYFYKLSAYIQVPTYSMSIAKDGQLSK